MCATAALLVGMFITMKAFTLSGEQVVDRDLGRFAALADLSVVSGVNVNDKDLTQTVAAAARDEGAQDVAVSLTSFDIRPDMLRPPVTIYVECNWTAEPFPARFSLAQGRWPARPGEVAVTRSLQQAANVETSLSVLSGNERWNVVGIVEDRFEAAPRILAAEGTWASLGPTTLQRFPTLTAAPALLWTGGNEQKVIGGVADLLAAREGSTSGTEVEVAAQIAGNLRTRATELTIERRSWVERLPIAYQLPSLALPALSVLAIFGLNSRRCRRSLATLRSVGMDNRHATGAITTALAVWTLISTTGGALAGVGLGLIARPLCDWFLAGPISPLPAMTSPLARLFLVTGVSCLLASVMLYFATREQPAASRLTRDAATPDRSNATRLGTLRRLGALTVGAAALSQVPTMDTVPKAMILTGTLGLLVLLLTPEITTAAIRAIPTADPRARLGRQQLANDKDRAVTAVAILTAVLGAPLAMLTLLATFIDSAQDDIVPIVAPHQVVLSSPAGHLHPPTPETVKVVTASLQPTTPPVQVSYGWTEKAKAVVQGGGKGTILIIDTIEQVIQLNNGPLTPRQAETLQRGGMLVWSDTDSNQRTLINQEIATTKRTATSPIPAVYTEFQPGWETSVDGLLLTSTAERLGLPIGRAAIAFTGVSAEDAAAAKQSVLQAGLDPAQVGIHQAPDPIRVPTAFYGAAFGLAAIVLITTMAVARTQVNALRSYLGRLMSIGLSTAWVKQVLLLQAALIIGVSTLLGLLIAVSAVAITALRLPGLTLSVPWQWIGLTLGAYCGATITATLLSTRRLRPTDRQTT